MATSKKTKRPSAAVAASSKALYAPVVWSDEEWQSLAAGWLKDEQQYPDSTLAQRWTRVVPQVFEKARQRPLPKVDLTGRLRKLFEFKERLTQLPTSFVAPSPPEVLPPSQEAASLSEQRPVSPSSQAEVVDAGLAYASSASEQSEGSSKRRRIFWGYDERMAFVRTYVALEKSHPRMPAATRVERAQQLMVERGELRPDRVRAPNVTVILYSPELKPLLEEERARPEPTSPQPSAEVADSGVAQGTAASAGSAPKTPVQSLVDALLPATEEKASSASLSSPSAGLPGLTPELLAQTQSLSAGTLLTLAAGAAMGDLLQLPRVQTSLQAALAPLIRQTVRDVVTRVIQDLLGGPGTSSAPSTGGANSSGSGHSPTSEGGLSSKSFSGQAVSGDFSSQRELRKKLLVVGLLGSQRREIEQRFAQRFDLRFLTQDDSGTRLEQHARACDTTIGMVGYMSHSVEKHLKKAASDYRRCNGTVGELSRMLNALAAH